MSSNDAPLYSARDVASSRYQVRCVASSVSTPSSRARASSVSSSSLTPYPAVNSRPWGSRPRSSANSRKTTRIITVTAAW